MNIERVNKQDYLKFLASICMIIDHIGLYFVPNYWSFRAIGRVAFPIFAFYAGYNFHNKLNYKILLHGIILYLFSVLFMRHFPVPNILLSIFIGQLYLSLCVRYQILYGNLLWQYLCLIILWPFTNSYFEYGSITVLIMLIGNLYKAKLLSNFQIANQICLITIMHSAIVFGSFFSNIDLLIWIISMSILWIMLCSDSNYWQVQIAGIRQISRHSLYIYSFHLAVFMMISIWK